MSKSLKNFITIQQALASYTARQIRFFFLSHDWRGTLDYSQRSMQEAVELEKTFNEFFLLLKSELQQLSAAPADYAKLAEADSGLLSALDACKRAVHLALCDSIDTVSLAPLKKKGGGCGADLIVVSENRAIRSREK